MNEKIPNRRDLMFRRYGMRTLTLRQVGALMPGLLPADLRRGSIYGKNLAGLPGRGAGGRGDGASHKLDGQDLFLLGLEVLFH
jgi:hypothetical protein